MKTGPVIFGEVLYDCFPDGSAVLGGAPFNVYVHLGRMGLNPLMITRVGDDERGITLLSAMEKRSLSIEGIQTDPERFTGEVLVTFAEGNHPLFDIRLGQAWDAVSEQEALALMKDKEPSMLYCGTLILRSEESRKAGLAVLEKTNAPLFLDVNLRDPWWDKELAEQLLEKATWLKCNEQEAETLFSIQTEEQGRQRILEICKDLNLELFILTLSERGAMVTDGTSVWQAEPPHNDKPFMDSVGAGDSCACGFIEGIHKGYSPEESLQNALKLASEVCRVRGGVFPME